jgi:hypothetical protein
MLRKPLEFELKNPLDRGTVVRQHKVSGTLLMEAIFPSQVIMDHWHDKANFCLCLAGASTERYVTMKVIIKRACLLTAVFSRLA